MTSNTPAPFKASEVSIDLIGIWEERSVNSLILQTGHRGREHNTEEYFLYYQVLLIGSHMSFLAVSGMWRSTDKRKFKILLTFFIFRR